MTSPIGFLSSRLRVIEREPDCTVMFADGPGLAKAFAKLLIREEKSFSCRPDGEGFEFTVDEINHPNRWEAGA